MIATNFPSPGGVKISCAGTISSPFICGVNDFLIRATSLCGTGPCGMNSPLRGMGCVGAVCCFGSCGTGFSSIP